MQSRLVAWDVKGRCGNPQRALDIPGWRTTLKVGHPPPARAEWTCREARVQKVSHGSLAADLDLAKRCLRRNDSLPLNSRMWER